MIYIIISYLSSKLLRHNCRTPERQSWFNQCARVVNRGRASVAKPRLREASPHPEPTRPGDGLACGSHRLDLAVGAASKVTCAGSTRSPRPAAPRPWPRSATSSPPLAPAIPAPTSSCATRSNPAQALHKRSPYVRSPGAGRGTPIISADDNGQPDDRDTLRSSNTAPVTTGPSPT